VLETHEFLNNFLGGFSQKFVGFAPDIRSKKTMLYPHERQAAVRRVLDGGFTITPDLARLLALALDVPGGGSVILADVKAWASGSQPSKP
jgi:hypothetical protein